MKNFLPIIFICLSLLTKGQCTWTLAVASSNNSYELNCHNTSLNFSATHNCTTAVTYSWSGPAYTPMGGSVSITAPGTYSCAVVDANACVNTVTFAVSINTIQPTFTLSNLTSTWTCLNNGGTYTASAISPTNNISFEWYDVNSPPPNPPMYISNNQTAIFVPPVSGSYIARLINLINGCAATNTITISNNTGAPSFSVSNTNQIGCWPADTLKIYNVVLTNPNATASYSFLPPNNSTQVPIPGGMPLSPISSLAANIPGNYTVVVQDDANFCQSALPAYVTVSSNLNISFSHTVNTNGDVTFQNTSIGTNSTTSYFWDFGDGTSATGAMTNHTYANGGVHFATLQTTNPNCVSASGSVNVNTIPCVANSNYSLTFSGTPQFWYAVPDYYGNVTQAEWNWGDGTLSNSLFSSHTYSAAGAYNICLTVTVSCGNFSSTCTNNNIYKSTEAPMVHVMVVKNAPVGIMENVYNPELIIYPNPASENVTIFNAAPGNRIAVQVKDLNGRSMHNETIDTQEHSAKLNLKLENGVYFLILTHQDKTEIHKLIIFK